MTNIKIIFFGSTTDSVIVLSHLHAVASSIGHSVNLSICCIVTQPPRPIGRKQIVTPTPVETWAKEHSIPVLSFATNSEKSWLYENEEQVIDALQPFKADLLISASYGQKIPTASINGAKFGGLNVHPSLLPRWRGADPVPWAILAGDHQTGVSIVTLAEKFDEGAIIAQKKIPLTDTDCPDPIRTHLFTLGAELLIESLPTYLSSRDRSNGDAISKIEIATSSTPRNDTKSPYARKLSRDDGFIPWELLQKAMNGEDVPDDQLPKLLQEAKKYALPSIGHVVNLSTVMERATRALNPWPGVWTRVTTRRMQQSDKGTDDKVTDNKEEKRLKIISCHLNQNNSQLTLDQVQLEGKNAVDFLQFTQAYLSKQAY